MKFSSVKTKLLILVLISVSCSFIILGYYNASNEFKSEYELAKNKQIAITKETSKFIDDYLKSKIQVVSSVADMIENDNLTIQNKVLIDQLMLGKKSGDFASMYLGLQDSGDLIKFNGVLKSIATMNYDARIRPWYKKALRIKKSGVTEPFVDNTTKRLVITVFSPYKKNGKLIGVVGANIFLDTIVNEILNLDLTEGGKAYLLSNDGKILIHKDRKLLKKTSKLFKELKSSANDKFSEYTDNNIDKFIVYSKVPLSSWYLVVEERKDVIFKKIKEDVIKGVMIFIVLLLIILGFLYIMLKKLLNPLASLESGLNNFFDYLKGNKDNVTSLNIKTNDEFGNMAKKIDMEIDLVQKNLERDKVLIEDVKNIVNEIKDGKLDVSVNENSNNQSLNELKEILNEMIETISKNVHKDINTILFSLEEYSSLNFEKNIDKPSGKISKGLNNLCDIINEMLQENYQLGITLQSNAKTLLDNVNVLNKASNETAVSLEETSASIEEITTTIVETTNNIVKMVKYNSNLVDSINDGQKLAGLTAASMNEINEQTAAIAEAITVIDQIAFQTNILSLNAAVEAATAGESGKGFAVVAAEVRNLASRSAEAAKEIKELVENATLKTDTGKKNADKMIEGYVELNENINKTTEVIKHIEKASNEQKIGMEQINDAVTNLDSRTQQNASVATMTQEISVNTSNIADNILESVSAKKFRKN